MQVWGRKGIAVLAAAALFAGVALADSAPTEARSWRHRRSQAPRQISLDCNPIAATSCALPYPSDFFSVADPGSPTGIRLSVSDDVWPADFRSQLPASLAPSKVYGGHDGFSANGPILFELDAPVDPASLPRDGGDGLVVYDLGTGLRVPVLAEVDAQAAAHSPPAAVVRAWPRTRFEWGHRYVAALTTALRRDDGSAPGRTTGFAAVVGGSAAEEVLARYRPLLEALERQGHESSTLVSVTGFTVRSEQDATGLERALAARARADEHPVRSVRALPVQDAHVAALVSGTVRLTDFRSPLDAAMQWDPEAGRENWVPFVLTVPHAANTGAVPVAVYSHGLTTIKESFLALAGPNARRGMATVAIDHPNHGARAGADGGLIEHLAMPSNAARLLSIAPQSSIDFVSLVQALRTSLAELDVVPFGWRALVGAGADGRPDLDPSRIVVEGTSMGGVLGLAFMGLEPHLQAGMFQVPGVGIMHILTGSTVWHGLHLSRVIPAGARGADMAAAIAACQFLMDPGDPANYTGELQAGTRPLVVVWGEGDSVVPNYSTERLVQLTGLPHLTAPDAYAGWSGEFVQPQTLQLPPLLIPLQDALQHLSFAAPDPMELLNRWLDAMGERLGAPA